MNPARRLPVPLRLLLIALLALTALLQPGIAAAKGGDDTTADDGVGGGTASAVAGEFAVTVNGRSYNPAAGRETRLQDVVPTGKLTVRGVHVTFTVDPATLGVYDYALTGAPAPDRMVTAPTVLFASKVPVLTPAQLAGVRIEDMRLRDD